MATAAKILFAREDLSIPGAADPAPTDGNGITAERRFFDLLRDSKPDAVLLDLSRANGAGVETILRVRRRSTTPILVACDLNHPSTRDYRIAGAADCMPVPIDILLLNQALQQIINLAGPVKPRGAKSPEALSFAGITFRQHENVLSTRTGSQTRLTISENRLLLYLAATPGVPRSRDQIGKFLYGRHRPANDRAVDDVVNRLRKKLARACPPMGEDLIRAEVRRGYMLVADVSVAAPSTPTGTTFG